jgi:hypothetical protein
MNVPDAKSVPLGRFVEEGKRLLPKFGGETEEREDAGEELEIIPREAFVGSRNRFCSRLSPAARLEKSIGMR